MKNYSAKEMQEIKCQQEFYGFKQFETSFFNAREYKKFRNLMLDSPVLDDVTGLHFKFCHFEDVLKTGKYALEKYIPYFNLKIPHISYAHWFRLYKILTLKFGSKPQPQDYKEIIKYIKDNIELRYLLDIPVYYHNDDEYNGESLNVDFYKSEDVNSIFYKDFPVVASKIRLYGPSTELLKLMYIHELYHLLTNNHKGNIINLLHNEVLPIFMECVTALDIDPSKDLLTRQIIYRLSTLKIDIILKTDDDRHDQNHIDVLENETYIASTLLALALFNIYEKHRSGVKREIIENIKNILNGDICLEDVIKYYGISYENGIKVVWPFVKSLKKS